MDTFKIMPMLVINVTDKCNMKCIYCPPFGENLCGCNNLCNIDSIVSLIRECFEKGIRTLRITGGEPFLSIERTKVLLVSARNVGYTKIVLNTNGSLFEEKYETIKDVLNDIKEILLLKISLDTLSHDKFVYLTRSSILNKVIENIKFANSLGYRIELNCVVSEVNYLDVLDLAKFISELKINLKLLTINDFGGLVQSKDIHKELNSVLGNLSQLGFEKYKPVFLNGNTGIQMKRFYNSNNNTVTVVDHSVTEESITQKRVFAKACLYCEHYPCNTGMMNLFLRADGLLYACRLRSDKGYLISAIKESLIDKYINELMKEFSECFVY